MLRIGEEEPRGAAWGGDGPVAVGAALVEVFVQAVEAAGVAEFPDPVEEVEGGDARLLGPATVQVFAVGVDKGGPVGGAMRRPVGSGMRA